ncbi:MAG TPA: ABC transporter permease subunit [Chloroflexota bacterium]|jgi:ABC-type transport system involved in multi-copper enzyme maturation permease subunit|nr:ABC transporter permease subunit [Chloroflexota bacterium]
MSVPLNPLIVRELRGGLRSGRRIALLTFCLGVVSMFFLGVYVVTAASLDTGNGSVAIGSTFFPMVVGVELFLVCVMTPAQTAGAIVSERERLTYDVLLVSPLTPRQIVLGKLSASLAYMLLLLVASLPIESLAFLMGGVDPVELLLALLLLLGTLAFFGSVGIWTSAIFRGSRAATAVAYSLSGVLTLGLPILALFMAPLMGTLALGFPSLLQQPPPWLVYTGELLAATNPWLTAGLTEAQLQTGLPLFWFHQTFGKTNVDLPGPWLIFLLTYGVGSLRCLAAAARAVRRRRAGA